VTGANVGTAALAAVQSWWLWVPVVVFFIGFWLLGAVINRGRWGHWVIFGLLVGVVAYAGTSSASSSRRRSGRSPRGRVPTSFRGSCSPARDRGLRARP
jgi:hypothetical protein